jgi:hypothetical protein
MIEQMKKIHSQRGANELNYDIIEDEVIGNGSNGVWGRYQWWSVKDLDVIFIEPW